MTSDSIARDQIGIINDMREVAPLAAAPATERSERVGEEAEESQMQALCTYAPVPVSACVLFIGCAVFTSVRLFTPDMVHFPSILHRCKMR